MDNLIDERQRTLSQRLIESIRTIFWKRLDQLYDPICAEVVICGKSSNRTMNYSTIVNSKFFVLFHLIINSTCISIDES